MTTAAAHQRRYRTTRALRLQVALALVDVGRLGEWDETNLAAIDKEILRLAVDWAKIVVNSNGRCPLRCALNDASGKSPPQEPHEC